VRAQRRHARGARIIAARLGLPLRKALLGAGKATATLNESYDPHAPAFDEEDWEMNR
jgi:hypothetical protein